MTDNTNVFVDRRSDDERKNDLMTQVLFWYDTDSKRRTRTNGIAVTVDGKLVVARSTCSKKDQFVRAQGRMKVTSRIFGRAKKHCWVLDIAQNWDNMPAAVADAYAKQFPSDEMGVKRAFNIGKVYHRAMTVVSATLPNPAQNQCRI